MPITYAQNEKVIVLNPIYMFCTGKYTEEEIDLQARQILYTMQKGLNMLTASVKKWREGKETTYALEKKFRRVYDFIHYKYGYIPRKFTTKYFSVNAKYNGLYDIAWDLQRFRRYGGEENYTTKNLEKILRKKKSRIIQEII